MLFQVFYLVNNASKSEFLGQVQPFFSQLHPRKYVNSSRKRINCGNYEVNYVLICKSDQFFILSIKIQRAKVSCFRSTVTNFKSSATEIATIAVFCVDLFSNFCVCGTLDKFVVLNDFIWSDLRFGKWYHATQ